MDSLTTNLIARELDARWRGRRIEGVALDRATRQVRCSVEDDTPVVFDLSSPDVEVRESGGEQAPGALLAGWRIVTVTAPVDERLIAIECEKVGRFRGSPMRRARLVVSVVPAARGALLEDSSGHRLGTLGGRMPTLAEPRPQPAPSKVELWTRERDSESLLGARWMSPALVEWLAEAPERAEERYAALCSLPRPTEEACGAGLLPPWLCSDASLIRPAQAEAPVTTRRDGWKDRALQRMRDQLSRAEDAPRLRAVADALTAHGDASAPPAVVLPTGERVEVDARPGENSINVAERLYREVRSMERALETLPRRIAELERTTSPPERRSGRPARGDASRPAPPYRLYRSSGGLEIWVGRGAASNDAITFRESAPADVWLHARSAAGAHVILRWQKDDAPPARDLEEAAMLAAWHSKARGSTVVPVDWTRRRYVRKARGAGLGKVVITQSQTLFVRPAQELERRLRANP